MSPYVEYCDLIAAVQTVTNWTIRIFTGFVNATSPKPIILRFEIPVLYDRRETQNGGTGG